MWYLYCIIYLFAATCKVAVGAMIATSSAFDNILYLKYIY